MLLLHWALVTRPWGSMDQTHCHHPTQMVPAAPSFWALLASHSCLSSFHLSGGLLLSLPSQTACPSQDFRYCLCRSPKAELSPLLSPYLASLGKRGYIPTWRFPGSQTSCPHPALASRLLSWFSLLFWPHHSLLGILGFPDQGIAHSSERAESQPLTARESSLLSR